MKKTKSQRVTHNKPGICARDACTHMADIPSEFARFICGRNSTLCARFSHSCTRSYPNNPSRYRDKGTSQRPHMHEMSCFPLSTFASGKRASYSKAVLECFALLRTYKTKVSSFRLSITILELRCAFNLGSAQSWTSGPSFF
jgi:hypothetical protein